MPRNLVWATLLAGAALAACGPVAHNVRATLEDQPGFGFFFVDEGGSAKLAYGQADSDNVGLMLECAKGSGLVEVSDLVRSAPAAVLTLASGGGSNALRAEVQAGEGSPMVVTRVASSAPAMAGFRKSGRLEVAYAGLSYGLAARPFEQISVQRFFNACDGRAA
jgi:hypothetical protein